MVLLTMPLLDLPAFIIARAHNTSNLPIATATELPDISLAMSNVDQGLLDTYDLSTGPGSAAQPSAVAPTPVPPLPSTLLSLPNEILLTIADYLNVSSLGAIAVASRSLNEIAMRTKYEIVRISSLYDEDDWEEYTDHEPVLQGSIVRLYEVLQTSFVPIGPWIKRFEVEVFPEEVTVSSNAVFPLCPIAPRVTCRISHARFVGQVLYHLPELRELSIDMTYGVARNRELSSIQYLFGRDDVSMHDHIPEIPAFKHLKRLTWDCHHLPAAVVCLPTLEHLSLHQGCLLPDPSKWGETPGIKSLELRLSAAALLMDPTSPEWQSADDHLFSFIGSCNSLTRLKIALSPIEYPSSTHVEHACAFVQRLTAVNPALESLVIGPALSCHRCLDHIMPVQHAVKSFGQLKHLRIPQEMLFEWEQLPSEIGHRFASVILPESLETLEIQYPYKSVFRFLECVKTELSHLSALKKISISCCNDRGMRYARKDGIGGMLFEWNNSSVVKELYRLGICLSIGYSDWDPPEAWKDVYERAALGLERHSKSLGPEMSPEAPLIIGSGQTFTWWRGAQVDGSPD